MPVDLEASEESFESSQAGPQRCRMQTLLVAIGTGALILGGAMGALVALGASGFFSTTFVEDDRSAHSSGSVNDIADVSLPTLEHGLVNFNQVFDGIKTGKVVNQSWEVKWRNCPNNGFNQPCGTDVAPGPIFHGVRSKAITINDMTPGPMVEADLGDLISIEVKNNLNEPITVHFHGITQFGTPYMDGTPLSNCAIPPGGFFNYEFYAHPVGTTFYHSHVSTQHEAGLSGLVHVRDPKDISGLKNQRANYSTGPEHFALFKDWWSSPAQTLYYFWQQNSIGGCLTFSNPDMVAGFNPAVFSWQNKSTFNAVMGDALLFESVVVNGKGVYDYESTQLTVKTHGLSAKAQFCPGQMDPPKCQICYTPGQGSKKCDVSSAASLCGAPEVFEVEQGNSSIIHLVSDAQLYMLQVCIDGHNMTILGSDMMPVSPFETKCVIMGPGERYDISVAANQEPGDYKIRFITLEYGAYLESQPWQFNCGGKPGGPCNLGAGWGSLEPNLPHQGFALLRYKGAAIGLPKNPDGPNYWLSAKTLGCSSIPTRNDPQRCHMPSELKGVPNTLHGYYGNGSWSGPHEHEPTVRFTAQISFLPDEVPRTENKALLSRMQIYGEERGFPFMWTDDASGWEPQTPTAFLFPDQPTLSLPASERESIYTRRHVWRESNTSNVKEAYPNYPKEWSKIQSGCQTISVDYGDVVRIFMNATIPFGAGAAMPHPMHLHGHKVAVLAMGKWDEPYDESKLNTENPIYKDVVPLYSDSWFVIQFVAANPGVWMFHCHVNIHVNSGMGMAIDVGGDLSAARRTPDWANMCSGEPTGI